MKNKGISERSNVIFNKFPIYVVRQIWENNNFKSLLLKY